MVRRLLICTELSTDEMRGKGRAEVDRRAAMRMLAIANALEGMSRSEVARLADTTDHVLFDAVKRYNVEGIDGLRDRPRSGRPAKMTEAQRGALRAIVITGPDIEAEGTSSCMREDLCEIAREKWGVDYAVKSMDRTLRKSDLSRQKTRASHPKRAPAAAEAFKNGSRETAGNCSHRS